MKMIDIFIKLVLRFGSSILAKLEFWDFYE